MGGKSRRVTVIPGDDAAPEAVLPSVKLLTGLAPALQFTVLPSGEQGQAQYGERFGEVLRTSVDGSDSVLFGASSGKTPIAGLLRWGKETYANVRPIKYLPGANSPLKHAEGIDFVIVRENLEDIYVGAEGELGQLAKLGLVNPRTGTPLHTMGKGNFAIKVITEEGTQRIARFACRLAIRRRERGGKGKVTCSAKYNLLRQTDGLFRRVVEEVVRDEYPTLQYEEFIIDNLSHLLIKRPQDFDVVVLPNQYGDILSDEAAALVGGLGLGPSGCYGDDWAYFEPSHGTAPDIAGKGIINPTATLLSAAMMLDYLGLSKESQQLEEAIRKTYVQGKRLTPDQGGSATSVQFCQAVMKHL